jgi:hypothetical protein
LEKVIENHQEKTCNNPKDKVTIKVIQELAPLYRAKLASGGIIDQV